MKPIQFKEGHDNFFTPLRLFFASMVVIGHAYAVALRDATLEPQLVFHYTFSYLAVNLFFIASGFLVTKSMTYRGDAAGFVSARALRIFPALIVHVLFVMFIIGPLATNQPLGAFFASPDWYLQPLKVLTFYETNMVMPGIFATNGEQFGSAPLWTLRYEVLAYIATLLMFLLGFMRKKWMVLAQFVLPSIAWIVGDSLGLWDHLPGTVMNMCRFGIAYGLGACIYAYRDRLNFGWVGLAVCSVLAVLLRGTPVVEVLMNAVLAWIVFRLAYMKAPALAFLQRVPDLSYGIYIYHWCVLQLLFYWLPDLSVISLFVLTFPITAALAALSWYLVEKPMLRKKAGLAEKLRRNSKPFTGELLLD